MTLLWIVPPLLLLAGAIGAVRTLTLVGRRTGELRLALARSADVRSSTVAVRAAAEDARRSFTRLGRR